MLLSTYCKHNDLNEFLMQSIINVLDISVKTMYNGKAFSQAHTNLIATLAQLFENECKTMIKPPLDAKRTNLDDLKIKIGLDTGCKSIQRLVNTHSHTIMFIHRNLTLINYIENPQKLNGEESRLECAEKESAKVLLHAFNLYVNYDGMAKHNDVLYPQVANLLNSFIIRCADYGDDIEGHFGLEALKLVADHNADLFNALALSIYA